MNVNASKSQHSVLQSRPNEDALLQNSVGVFTMVQIVNNGSLIASTAALQALTQF